MSDLEARVKALEDWQQRMAQAIISAPAPKPIQPKPVTQPPPSQAEIEIRRQFTVEQEETLSFEDKGDYWLIKPVHFLGSEMFSDIASVVRAVGGEYISAGKDSHFRVLKKKA